MINYCVNKPEDEQELNDFIWDLRELMEKHGVCLQAETTDFTDGSSLPVATFYAYEDIKDPDFDEVLWFCEIHDMWPTEYDLADSGEIVQVRS